MADLSDSANWFEVDGSNNRPPPNGWPEGMMPSGVNDTARADKGALKRFWDKLNPVQNITAAGGVYTFVTSNTAYPTAYVAGELYSFKALTTSTGGDQFQVNALGPRAIVKWRNSAWVPIVAGDIEGATAPQLIYDAGINAGVGGFILLNPHLPVVNDGAGGTSLDGSLTVGGDIHAGGSAYLGGDYLLFNGNTTNSQGPYIALDGTNAILRFGPGNGGFYFENNAGTPLVTINNGGDLGQYGPYIYLNNSSGGINGAGGPLVFGDGSWLIVKPGVGNLGFMVQDYNGNNRFQVSGDGHLYNNTHLFAFCDGTYNQLFDAAGNDAIALGNGVNYYRTNTHQFQTVGGGATQMTLDGAGNATIGGSLTANGNITGAQAFIGGIQLFNNGGWLQSPNIRASTQLYTDGNATVIGNLQVSGNINAGAINASGDIHGPNLRADGSLFVGGVQVYNNGGWLYSPSSMQSAGTVQANASGAAALYAPNGGISAGGSLTCQNVNASNDIAAAGVYRLHPVGGGSKGARIEGFSGSAWDYLAIAFDGGSNILFSPNDGASGRAVTTVTFSDARLKDNIRDTEVDALAVILATPVRAFEWNEEGRLLTPHRPDPVPCGLVAQELEEAIPLAVGTVSLAGDMRHIIDQHLTPYLMRAIQQLAERVTQVEAR